MADLRIVDAPVLLQESITDDVKMPTGGLGNFSIRLGDIVWYVVTKEQLANKNYVDLSSKGVKDSLDEHIADKANPHQVTKAQVGLGSVDNTADVDKPVSNAVESALLTKADKVDTYSKSEVDTKVSTLSSTTYAGHKGYLTLADAQAAQASLPANTLVEVTNDSDTAKNRVYLWNGTTLTKSDYDPLAQTKPFIDVLSNTNQRQAVTFYYAPSNIIVKETNSALFAVSIKVKPKQKYVFNTKTFGVVGSYYIADASGNVLQTLSSSETLEQDYVIEIPTNGAMLYVNCQYSYANFKCYLLNNELSNLSFAELDVDNFQFYTGNDSGIVVYPHVDFFSKDIDVSEGEYYQIRTETYGIAPQYLITDNSNTIILFEPSGNRGKTYIVRIPKDASKLYVNCIYALRNSFKVEKITDVFANSLSVGTFVLDYTFFYAPSNTIKQESNDGLFALVLDVQANQKYSINTKTFGVVGEYYVTDSTGNILQFKVADSVEEEYIITIPANASKLYVNCMYEFADNFNFERISSPLLASVPFYENPVRSIFPTFNYFDKLRVKCPNFYQKFKDKNEDVTVVLTGTSLTQGNLYASDRVDATTRPPALHTNDFASAVFDKLIKHWGGQKYRRYDHADLTYSSSAWQVINQLQVSGSDVWDDYAYRKNGLTKTTTDANASVSMTIPSDAWQFNFVYRSDSQGGNRTVTISQDNGLVEAWNGSAWVEANGFVFSSLEPAATATKGNTTYQKRLKMRCKNKAGGINSIGTAKTITISKGNDATRFNVVGFEWSPREFMLTVINSARGSHQWGDKDRFNLANYQDNDIWQFNPDLLLAEISIINWGASEPSALSVDPLFYVNAAKRGYFNEFNDFPNALYPRLQAYGQCEVVFYSDTLACTWAVADAWDSATHEPKFGTVTGAATNGSTVSNENVGRAKTNFENYEAVERYVASKDFLFIPVLSTFKAVADKYYGNYWNAMQPSDKAGDTLSYDGVHFNDNGAALLSSIVASVFDQL